MSAHRALFAIAAAALLAAGTARAQALVDPTRPPNAPAPGEAQDAAPAVQLQSILISRSRRLAIINGDTVALGGTFGEAKVVKITETEVTLQKGDETEVLKLFPGIDKQPAKRRTRISQKPSSQGRQQ